MDNSNHTRSKSKLIGGLVAVLLLVIAGLIGWILSTRNQDIGKSNDNSQAAVQQPVESGTLLDQTTYSLPDGWKEATCPAAKDKKYISPPGSTIDCAKDPSAPVRMVLDSADTKDCNELQGAQEVKKHVCISLFINGSKSLKATTEYLSSSSYGREITVDAYYIDSGKGVLKAEHIYQTNDGFGAGFDQLVNSISFK